MKKTIISTIVVAVFIAVVIFIINKNQINNSVSEIPQEANVASVANPFVPIDDIDPIPSCIESVNPVSSGGCAVQNCSGQITLGSHNFSLASIALCVPMDSWEGWDSSYTPSQYGCLANQCLNHSTDLLGINTTQAMTSNLAVSDMKPPVNVFEKTNNPTEADIVDIDIDPIPSCVDDISSAHPEAGGACVVYSCNGGTTVGAGPLSSAQINNCTGQDTIPSNTTSEQLGCLASECLYYTGIADELYDTTNALMYERRFSNFGNGSQDPIVLQLERQLSQKGFFIGTPNTTFDQATIRAMQNFQRSAGLRVTGVLDATTFNLLFAK